MRDDLILRYLGSSYNRLNLVLNQLNKGLIEDPPIENPTTLNEHGESTLDPLIKAYVPLLKEQLQQISVLLENLK